MFLYRKVCIFFFVLIVSLSSLSLLGKEKEKKTVVLGNIEFKYADTYILNKIKLPRTDVVTFIDKRYESDSGFVFAVAPLKYKDNSMDADFLAMVRADIVQGWLKNKGGELTWKSVSDSNAISKYQTDVIRIIGTEGKITIFFEFRRVVYKDKDFIVGTLLDQEKAKKSNSSFNNGIIGGVNYHHELMMAKLAASVTGEEDPNMWPPGGLKAKDIGLPK